MTEDGFAAPNEGPMSEIDFERRLEALVSEAVAEEVSVRGAWDVTTPEEYADVTVEIWPLQR